MLGGEHLVAAAQPQADVQQAEAHRRAVGERHLARLGAEVLDRGLLHGELGVGLGGGQVGVGVLVEAGAVAGDGLGHRGGVRGEHVGGELRLVGAQRELGAHRRPVAGVEGRGAVVGGAGVGAGAGAGRVVVGPRARRADPQGEAARGGGRASEERSAGQLGHGTPLGSTGRAGHSTTPGPATGRVPGGRASARRDLAQPGPDEVDEPVGLLEVGAVPGFGDHGHVALAPMACAVRSAMSA